MIVFSFSDLFRRDCRIFTAGLVLLPILIYWQVWDFPFLWDDDNGAKVGHIYNPFVLEQNFTNFIQLFKDQFFGMYIPISYAFWGGIKAFSELFGLPNNSVFHTANVLIHITNGLLIFVLLRQFIANNFAVFIGVLFFLLHPIQVESVVWVSEFRGLLAAFFALLSLYFYMQNQTVDGRFWRIIVALICFLLALLSKPSAVVLPVFILAINHFYYNFELKKIALKTTPFVLVALIIVVISYLIQSRYSLNFDQYTIPIWQRPLVFFDSIIFYLAKVIYPLNLGASYGLPPIFIANQWWFLPLVFLPVLMGFALFFVRQKYRLLVLAAVLFVAGFLTTSGLVSFAFQKYSIVADRYLYLAFFGVAFGAAIIANSQRKYLRFLLLGILLLFASLSAFRQIPIWQSQVKLWTHSRNFEVLPKYASGHFYNLALVDAINGKDDEALSEFADVLANEPLDEDRRSDYVDRLFYNIGAILVKQKKYQEAIKNFDKSIIIDPKKAEVHNAKIHTHLQLKQCQLAKIGINSAQKLALKVAPPILKQAKKICPNND